MNASEENSKILIGFMNGQPLYGTLSFTVNNPANSTANITIGISDKSSNSSAWIPRKTDDEIIEEYIRAKFKL